MVSLRAEPGPHQSTPVLAVTGRTEQADIQACLAAGINGCIAKPVDAGELYRAIEAALSAAQREEAVA